MFIESRFFTDIRPEAYGGPSYRTNIKQLRGGAEHRNSLWADPLRSFTVSLSARDTDLIHQLLDFVANTSGAANAFRLKDWSDFKSCLPQQTPTALDLPVGTGDGTTYWFRLYKPYGSTYQRRILKPVSGTVLVSVDGATLGPSAVFTDHVNGVVVFKVAPAPGAVIKAGFQFDVPVRFSEDATDILMLMHSTGTASNIGLQEVRVKEAIDTAAYDAQRALM